MIDKYVVENKVKAKEEKQSQSSMKQEDNETKSEIIEKVALANILSSKKDENDDDFFESAF